MITKNLTLNLLNFGFTTAELSCYISTTPVDGGVLLSYKERDFLIEHGFFSGKTEALYSSFDAPVAGTKKVTLMCSKQDGSSRGALWPFSFLKKYYSWKLKNHFEQKDFPVRSDMIADTEIWMPATSPLLNCKGYKTIRLRVQFERITPHPELLITYDGVHSVYQYPLTHDLLQEVDTTLYSWMLFRNKLYRYDALPDEARLHEDEVYPCMNKRLKKALRTPFPAPDKSNPYQKFFKETEGFRNSYLTDTELNSWMPISNDWVNRESVSLLADGETVAPLLFGAGKTDTDPQKGIKQHGPRKLPDTRNTVFFFICHRNDIAMAKTIHSFLEGKQPGFSGISRYAGIHYSNEKGLSVYFENKENPLPEIAEQLNSRTLDNNKTYIALYLSPYGKWDELEAHRNIYYRIKEELLFRNIVTQTLEVEKTWVGRNMDDQNYALLKQGFNYFLPNISVALLAKLGGTPWSLTNGKARELVIGISAFKSDDLDRKYLGSAFSFSGEGEFREFGCFRSNQINELAGSILVAVRDYCHRNDPPEKLIIHFYKTMSRKELAPIEKGLAELQLDIPVVVISINKTLSEDILAIDRSSSRLMPESHQYLQVAENRYLLYNNGTYPGSNFNEREGYPFPIKISLQYYPTDSIDPQPCDEEIIPELFLQICQFSQLYWKSVSRQALPVTLRYPEMLAQIVPHFSRPELPRFGKETLWFL